MSRAAQELAAKFVKHYGLDPESPDDDGTCDRCVLMVDETVKPLASAAEAFAIHGTAENAERLWKALEPWRQS